MAMAKMQQKQLQDAMQMQVDDVKGKLQAEYAVKIAKVQADAQIDRAASDAKIAIKSEEARQRMALRDAQTAQRLRAQSERERYLYASTGGTAFSCRACRNRTESIA